MENFQVVAVHIGAGYYSANNRSEYEELCKRACKHAYAKLRNGGNAIDAVVAAVIELEDSKLTNAGIGSNLTEDGCVECDASVMDGKTLNWGAVGALSGIKNPVVVAKEILLEQQRGLSLGRIAPCLLVGQGAQKWAQKHGFQLSLASELISEKAEVDYLKYKKKLEDFESRRKKRKLEDDNYVAPNKDSSDWLKSNMENNVKCDTVGAVVLDSAGNVASAVSSGGIILKHPGRVGQAGSYGSGCWAANSRASRQSSLAVTTTGGGEHLIKTFLAKECAEMLAARDDSGVALQDVFRDKFLNSPYLGHVREKFGGAIVLKHDSESNICELLWAHTTRNLCLGFMSNTRKTPQVIFSELPNHLEAGQNFHVEGTVLKLPPR